MIVEQKFDHNYGDMRTCDSQFGDKDFFVCGRLANYH